MRTKSKWVIEQNIGNSANPVWKERESFNSRAEGREYKRRIYPERHYRLRKVS